MPNKTLSQFTEQTEADINDFAVGYGPGPNGQPIEKRYSLPTLGSSILPYSGLTTGSFQIRALAESVYDYYAGTAVTTKEEVISWGFNATRAKWGNNAATFATTLIQQTPAKPAIIPFFEGTPLDPGVSINLKETGRKITKIIDSRAHTMVLLDNGTVWLKCAVNDNPAVGYAQGFGPNSGTARTLTGFFQIPSVLFKSSIDSTPVAIQTIGMLPETVDGGDTARAVYWAIDENDDLHIWGSFGNNANGQYPPNLYEPKNVGADNPTTLWKNVKECVIVGAARRHTIFALTKDGRIFCQGHNSTGIAGTGPTTNLLGWTQCKKLNSTTDFSAVDINDAETLAFSTYSYHTFGYISKPVNGVNSIYISGAVGNTTGSVPNYPRPATTNVGTNIFFVRPSGGIQSGVNNPFTQLHIQGMNGVNPGATALALTLNGGVVSAGNNQSGEGGRVASGNVLALGSEFSSVGWRTFSLSSGGASIGSSFGGPSRFKALKIIVDKTSTTRPCTAIIAYDNVLKKNAIFLAGFNCLANGGGNFSQTDSTFRPLAFGDSALDCVLISDGPNHVSTLILSENLRTYGLGSSLSGFISETNGWAVLPQLIF